MGHLVRYLTGAGERRFEEVESLDAALQTVERLQQDGVSDVHVFREVPIEVRTYYKVVAVEPAAAPPAPEIAQKAPPAAADEPPPGSMPLRPTPVGTAIPAPTTTDDVDGTAEAEAEAGADGGRRSLFGRG